jgi:hypothetical protein
VAPARNAIPFAPFTSVGGALPRLVCFTEMTMPTKLKIIAIAAALAAGTSGAAMAQYACPAGYTYYNGVCQAAPAPAPGYGPGPLSGAAAGGAAGAANGGAAAGPVGAIVGGAIGTATGAVAGTANAVAGTANALAGAPPTPACGPGYTYYNGGCYPGMYGR